MTSLTDHFRRSRAAKACARLVRWPRSHGFGVQSPWAFQFLKHVIRGPEATLRSRVEAYNQTATERRVEIVEGIRTDRQALHRWQQRTADPATPMTFDLWNRGLVCHDPKLNRHCYKVTCH